MGMPHKDIPNLLGRVLSGTKYGVKQTRGKFGLGAKMALIWSKMSTGLPIEIRSARRAQGFVSFYKLDIDIHKCVAPRLPCTIHSLTVLQTAAPSCSVAYQRGLVSCLVHLLEGSLEAKLWWSTPESNRRPQYSTGPLHHNSLRCCPTGMSQTCMLRP